MRKKQFNIADKRVQRWGRFSCQNQTYDLSHLDSCIVIYEIGNQYYQFYTAFTKTVSGYNDEDCWAYRYEKDQRNFHIERYNLSLNLPMAIKSLPDAITYHARRGSYAVCETLDDQGQIQHYQIAFVVYRDQRKLRLHVTSAYPIDTRPKVKKVGFNKIVRALVNGRPLPQPHK